MTSVLLIFVLRPWLSNFSSTSAKLVFIPTFSSFATIRSYSISHSTSFLIRSDIAQARSQDFILTKASKLFPDTKICKKFLFRPSKFISGDHFLVVCHEKIYRGKSVPTDLFLIYQKHSTSVSYRGKLYFYRGVFTRQKSLPRQLPRLPQV